ncbi:hypothetical protein VPH35_117521 [Triticum aestivum]|uniref:Uncharacterized protein n=1 Tax=Aegilops tauschii subsp. strangulata TaxID=200361 RepID=A0A453P8B0_AEGTS
MGESTMAIGGNWSSMAKSHHQKEKPPPPGAPEAHNSLPAPPQTQNGAFKKVTTLPWRRRRPNQSCGLSPGCRGRGGGGGEPQRRLQEGDDEVAAAAAGGQGVTPIQSTPLHIHAANNQIGSNLT